MHRHVEDVAEKRARVSRHLRNLATPETSRGRRAGGRDIGAGPTAPRDPRNGAPAAEGRTPTPLIFSWGCSFRWGVFKVGVGDFSSFWRSKIKLTETRVQYIRTNGEMLYVIAPSYCLKINKK